MKSRHRKTTIMKRLLIFILLCAVSLPILWAQDIIITHDSERIDVKVTEVSETDVRYKKADNIEGPTFVIATSKIASIIYMNGEVQIFSKPKTNAQKDVILKTASDEYIDLGLPSGTLWKNRNEDGHYTYKKAIKAFGNSLPTKAQLHELTSTCKYIWKDNGCLLVGPNGNSIFLPATGWAVCGTREPHAEGVTGSYWSSTPDMFDSAWSLDFGIDRSPNFIVSDRCFGLVVRLVK